MFIVSGSSNRKLSIQGAPSVFDDITEAEGVAETQCLQNGEPRFVYQVEVKMISSFAVRKEVDKVDHSKQG